jgi:hypothetical protein
MAKHIDPIPDNMTIEEASEFWDTHDVSDYPTRLVQFEYTPGEPITFVAIANQFLGQLEQRAEENGVSIETLINLWIQEKLIA